MAVSFTSGDDFIIPSQNGQTYLGGGGNDTYIITTATTANNAVITIQDTEGTNRIQLVDGLSISSSIVYSNALQLNLSNGAQIRILGAQGFHFDVGANATINDAGTTQTYAEFVTSTLGTTLPATGSSTGGSVTIPTGNDPISYQTTVSMAQLQGCSEAAPFDAGTGDFCFYLNAGTTLETAITDFDAGDTLRFENAPTGEGDFNVDQAAFDDGEAIIEVSYLTLMLLGLSNDYFYNADTFIHIFGQDALTFV